MSTNDLHDPNTLHQTRPDKRAKQLLPRRVPAILGLLIGITVLVRLSGVAESLFYLPSREDFPTPPRYQDVSFTTRDGLTLHGWFIPALLDADGDPINAGEEPVPRPTVLFLHGNAGALHHHDEFCEFLTRHGFNVFLFDYRGFGRSDPAKPTRNSLLIDTHAALDHLLARDDIDHARIGVMGYSLGGQFAAALTAERAEIKACALVATYASWSSVANDAIPFLGRTLIKPGLDAQTSIASFRGGTPLFITHGLRDRVVRPHHSQTLAQTARDNNTPLTLLMEPTANHIDIISGKQNVRDAIAEFFAEHLRPPTGE